MGQSPSAVPFGHHLMRHGGGLANITSNVEKLRIIMNQLPPNSTQCICSDLQHEDYSPLYAWFNYVLIILALPSLSVFGVLTNVVNVFVYSRKRMQNSANTYLLFLGCSDFLVILTGLFIFWIDSARSYIQELARAPYTTVYTLPFGYMAQTCSIYFTVAAAFDCYINVCWKNIAHHYCTVRRAKQICACVTICSIIYNSLRFPQFNLRKCFHDGSQEIIIEICPTTLFFTINTIYNVYMYMVLMTLLPFLFLLVLNAFIVVRQSIGSRNVSTSASQNFCIERTPSDFTTAKASTMGILEANGSVTTKTGASFQDGSGDDTLTMIMVVVLFLCCNTLALIVNMIETFFNPDPLLLNLLSDASNFLVIFNSSVNCVIYMIFNKEYRETFLLHAGRLLDFLKHQCGCCLSPRRATHGASFREHRLLYKPIASPTITSVEAAPKKRPDSLMREANNPQKHTEYGSCHSPVWQPLTSSSGLQNAALPLGEFWSAPFCCDQLATATSALTSPAPSFDPAPPSSSPDFVLADDDGVDSGCDDSQYSKSPTRIRKVQKSWIAEVKILESGDKPHILVKPISGFKPDGISITAL
ncbi:hypothetical protein QR680_005466 [Steinernema hermaphroditum]|uniref:G-protein coupled receptors family 1 profile domain-containing protein n=1 Tax=Steinernema hermaphroditum TaxID=289476 RepID=A0AA39HT74_9BILA|nr:hypothetical protein QR680_005466 [Steinernema hermaphroditum]